MTLTFNKINRPALFQRLRKLDMSNSLVDFFQDYLAPRTAVVIVQGRESAEFIISNQEFQGTVLGPPLWNVFFEPVDAVIPREAIRVPKIC